MYKNVEAKSQLHQVKGGQTLNGEYLGQVLKPFNPRGARLRRMDLFTTMDLHRKFDSNRQPRGLPVPEGRDQLPQTKIRYLVVRVGHQTGGAKHGHSKIFHSLL